MSAAPADRLSLKSIVCMCHIGVTEEERRARQKLEIDVDLYADLEAASRSGDLSATIDYREVCDAVRGRLEAGRFHLVEAAARAVLEVILDRFPAGRAVVRIRKFVLPAVAHVEVEIDRGRGGPA